MTNKIDVLANGRQQMAEAEAMARQWLRKSKFGRLGDSGLFWSDGVQIFCRIRISAKGKETVLWYDGDPDKYWGPDRISKKALLAKIEAAALARCSHE
jgi:hypothetical protein